MRNIIWFSCGAASFAVAWLMRKTDCNLVYCDTGGEHPDNKRFIGDAENVLGKTVTILRNDKYEDHIDVCEKTKYINGVTWARCTIELKRRLRFDYQRPDDTQYFGYTVEEKHRAERFSKTYFEVSAKYPLIEKGWKKTDCIGLLSKLGIEIPVMYKLGFNNNNCIGCVKGGMGYWNQVRKHFPDTFRRMAELERRLGNTCIKNQFLDELSLNAGRHETQEIDCDFICQMQLEKVINEKQEDE